MTKRCDNFTVATSSRHPLNQVIKVHTISDKTISVMSSCHDALRTDHRSGDLPSLPETRAHLEKHPTNPNGGTLYKITGWGASEARVVSQRRTEDLPQTGGEDETGARRAKSKPGLDPRTEDGN